MAKKALFTASTYSHIVHFHRPYLRALGARGWTVDVACGGTPMPIPEARRVIDVPFQKSITAPANFKAQSLLRREMKADRYDLISTHTALAAFFTRRAAIGLDTRVVNTCHGYLFDANTPTAKRLLLLEAERLTARRTDLLLTMNRCDYDIATRYRLGREIRNIPGIGVDFSRIDAALPAGGAALRSSLLLPEDAFVLLYPAEFSRRKSQETLIRAIALLPDRAFLLLPGSGELLEECKALSEKLGVAQRVRFPGYVNDMPTWYAAADCAVSSSRSEGLPFNVMEAMRARLPVVASAVKGHTDLVREGETGFLFPWGNSAACARAVRTLMDDPALVHQMGEAGAASTAQYSLEQVLPLVLDAYGV